MKVSRDLFLAALFLACPHLSYADTRCHTDSFGNTICRKSGVVDLSNIATQGTEAAQRSFESQERVRASELRREKEAFELERERQRWRMEQEAFENEQAKKRRIDDDENVLRCKKDTSGKITCEDNKGNITQYKAD